MRLAICPIRFASSTAALTLAAASLLITGCGAGSLSPAAPEAPATLTHAGLSGQVMGGRSPISSASIQLYQTGTTGYGTGASVIGTATTDANGKWSIGSFNCTAGTQTYVTSTGGNPGSGTNGIAVLMAGLTSCANIGTISKVNINELTTVASAYALQAFLTGPIVGAPTTNQTGLANAMADVGTLVDVTQGVAPGTLLGAGLPAGTTVPTTELNTLADAIAGCVNTNGTGSAQCTTLFNDATPSTTKPADTLAAALAIARNPANNPSGIITLASSSSPFQPILTSANDLTVTVLYSGSGLNSAGSLAVDAGGNVWVANTGGDSVTRLTHSGTALSGTSGYALATGTAPIGIAIDSSGNAWTANSGNNTVSKLVPGSGTTATVTAFSGGGMASPFSLAFDAQGNAWVANSSNTTVTQISSGGTVTAHTGVGGSDSLGVAVSPH